MSGFRRDGNKLIFERSNEIIQIEPWGPNSLRVRTTANRLIRDDLPGALLTPTPAENKIEIFTKTLVIVPVLTSLALNPPINVSTKTNFSTFNPSVPSTDIHPPLNSPTRGYQLVYFGDMSNFWKINY